MYVLKNGSSYVEAKENLTPLLAKAKIFNTYIGAIFFRDWVCFYTAYAPVRYSTHKMAKTLLND